MHADITAAANVLGLYPPGSTVDPDSELVVGGYRLADLAAAWGTQLYIVEEDAVRSQVRRFRHALETQWSNSRMVFASKAFPCTAMYRLMAEEGIGVDVAGAGERAMALAGGVDRARIVMHGNAKTLAGRSDHHEGACAPTRIRRRPQVPSSASDSSSDRCPITVALAVLKR